MEIALAILSLLAVVLPLVVKVYYGRKLDGEKARNVLIDRDVTQLRADLARLRASQTAPSLPQG